VDSWAIGVLTFELLIGCPPFYDQSRTNTEARIKSGLSTLPSSLSDGACAFITQGERPALLAGCLCFGSRRRAR
jgi:serine/threonine protein kinase